jgi:hypothetical protein
MATYIVRGYTWTDINSVLSRACWFYLSSRLSTLVWIGWSLAIGNNLVVWVGVRFSFDWLWPVLGNTLVVWVDVSFSFDWLRLVLGNTLDVWVGVRFSFEILVWNWESLFLYCPIILKFPLLSSDSSSDD